MSHTNPKPRRAAGCAAAAAAVVAAVLAAPPAAADHGASGEPIGSDEAVVSYPPASSACVGPDAGPIRPGTSGPFPDVPAGHALADAVRCLAHYRITVGYGDGTYRPEVQVSAPHMALFLRRAAALAGVDASEVIGDGIRSDPVTRAEMTRLIVNLLVAVDDNGVDRDDNGNPTIHGERASHFDYWADAYSEQPILVVRESSALYELGVVNGRLGNRFDGASPVTRAQMAGFITRALAHTGVRPAGMTAQIVGPEVVVTLRDADHNPVEGIYVDSFYAVPEDGPVYSDGDCTRAVMSDSWWGGFEPCVIDVGDAYSDDLGEAVFELPALEGGAGADGYVWTGMLGDEFNPLGIPGYDMLTIRLPGFEDVLGDPVAVEITTNLPDAPGGAAVGFARPGQTVTVTLQLVDAAERAVPPVTGEVRPEYSVSVETFGGAMPDPATLLTLTPTTVRADSDGAASFAVSASDLTLALGGSDAATIRYTVTGPYISGTATGTVVFTDASPMPAYLTVEPNMETFPLDDMQGYNRVTATVLDQFGRAVRGAKVTAESSTEGSSLNPGADGAATVYTTGSKGTASIGWRYTGANTDETIRVSYDGYMADDGMGSPVGSEGVADFGAACQAEDICAETTVLWTAEAVAGSSDDSAALLVLDARNDYFVADIGGKSAVAPVVLEYRAKDYFRVNGEPVGLDDFEAAVSEALDADPAKMVTVTWTAYGGFIAEFEATIT